LTASWLAENTNYFITGPISKEEVISILESAGSRTHGLRVPRHPRRVCGAYPGVTFSAYRPPQYHSNPAACTVTGRLVRTQAVFWCHTKGPHLSHLYIIPGIMTSSHLSCARSFFPIREAAQIDPYPNRLRRSSTQLSSMRRRSLRSASLNRSSCNG